MALPAGVTTATVIAGVPVTHTGAAVKAFVSIEPSAYLVHAATGTPLVDFIEELDISEGTAGQFILPHTDQAGFIDGSGAAYTNWYYTARVTYSTPSKAKTKAPKVKVFQLTTGQTTIDLDLLPEGAPALPYTAPSAKVDAFMGRTGAVTLLDADLPERLSETELSATIDARAVKVSEAPLDPRRYGATFDGVTDDTTALRAAFDALPATGGAIRIAGGKAITKRILVNGKNNVRVLFDRAELMASAAAPDTGAGDAGVVINFNACNDLDIRNAHINGNRANIPSQASGATNRGVQVAMKIGSSTRVNVLNPKIVEAVQDGISGQGNKLVAITNPTMENIGESGIYFSTGTEDVSIVGGTFKNTGASGDWGNIFQFRNNCQRITISGVVSEQSYGGIAMTEGITDVAISGFVGHNMGIPFSINTAGTINLTNARIRVTGSVFEASASPRAAFNTTVENFNLVACDFIGAFPHVSGFDTMVGCTLDGLTPGAGNPAAILKAKARILSSIIRNITGRGVEVQGAGSAVYDTQFDTLSDLAIRILAAGTGFRHGGNRYTAVTGGPLFDSTTGTLANLHGTAAAAATTLGAVSKKVELFDANGVSQGFIPVYASIT